LENRITKEVRSKRNLLNRNIGTYTPNDLLIMKDGEIYKLIKEELLDLRRGIRKSEPEKFNI
tara:strand:+ start:91 stop:276 length:186 start_codon:yes stop_codon:yes gene_type:complete